MDWSAAWKSLAQIWRSEAWFYRAWVERLLDENANLKRRLAARHSGTTTPLGASYGALVGPLDAPDDALQRAFGVIDVE